MKALLIAGLAIAALWLGLSLLREQPQVKHAQESPVRYVQNLQGNVQKADAARDKANAATAARASDVEDAAR
ncbi:MAG: hypothetical protein HY549_12835 [Elusimicrobia bacterium]|nr:hypothetical protein [Elusimicrobiota bacterium]